jgi:hypothetical protein
LTELSDEVARDSGGLGPCPRGLTLREETVAQLTGLLIILGLAKNVAVVQADEVVARHVGDDPGLLVRGNEGLRDEQTLEGLGPLGCCLHDAGSIRRSEALVGLVGWIEPVDLVSLGEFRDLWNRGEVFLAEAAFDAVRVVEVRWPATVL